MLACRHTLASQIEDLVCVLIACYVDHNAQHVRVQSVASAATSVNEQQKAFNMV